MQDPWLKPLIRRPPLSAGATRLGTGGNPSEWTVGSTNDVPCRIAPQPGLPVRSKYLWAYIAAVASCTHHNSPTVADSGFICMQEDVLEVKHTVPTKRHVGTDND